MYEVAKQALRGNFTLLPIEDVYYGPTVIDGLGARLEAAGIRKALLVTGKTLANKTPLVDKIQASADKRIAAVYADTQQHVHRGSVLGAIEQAREVDADGIIKIQSTLAINGHQGHVGQVSARING